MQSQQILGIWQALSHYKVSAAMQCLNKTTKCMISLNVKTSTEILLLTSNSLESAAEGGNDILSIAKK